MKSFYENLEDNASVDLGLQLNSQTEYYDLLQKKSRLKNKEFRSYIRQQLEIEDKNKGDEFDDVSEDFSQTSSAIGRMKSLEKKNLEYLNLIKKLKGNQKLILKRNQQLEESVRKKQGEIHERVSSSRNKSVEVEKLLEVVKELGSKNKQLRKQNLKVVKQFKSLSNKYDIISSKFFKSGRIIEINAKREKTLMDEIELLRSEVETVKNEVLEKSKEVRALRSRCALLKGKIVNLRKIENNRSILELEKNEILQRIEDMKVVNEKLIEENQKYKFKLLENQDDGKKMSVDVGISQLKLKREVLNSFEYQKLKKANDEYGEKVEGLEKKVSELQQFEDKLYVKFKSVEEQKDKAEKDLDALKKSHDELVEKSKILKSRNSTNGVGHYSEVVEMSRTKKTNEILQRKNFYLRRDNLEKDSKLRKLTEVNKRLRTNMEVVSNRNVLLLREVGVKRYYNSYKNDIQPNAIDDELHRRTETNPFFNHRKMKLLRDGSNLKVLKDEKLLSDKIHSLRNSIAGEFAEVKKQKNSSTKELFYFTL